MLVGTQRLAVGVGDVNRGAVTPAGRGKHHAPLPGAVGLDGPIALADNDATELAGSTGPGRGRDQRTGSQRSSQSCDKELLHADWDTTAELERRGLVIGDNLGSRVTNAADSTLHVLRAR